MCFHVLLWQTLEGDLPCCSHRRYQVFFAVVRT